MYRWWWISCTGTMLTPVVPDRAILLPVLLYDCVHVCMCARAYSLPLSLGYK